MTKRLTCPNKAFLLFLLLIANCVNIFAEDYITVDGLCFQLNDSVPKTVSVCRNTDWEHPYSGNVTIPEKIKVNDEDYTVTAIDIRAFNSCMELTSISIPASVTQIGVACFAYCSQLTKVELSTSLEEIPSMCFFGCNNLEAITIPANVETMGKNCFDCCSGLHKLICLSTIPPKIDGRLAEISFFTVYVPKEAVAAYKAADIWKDYKILAIQK